MPKNRSLKSYSMILKHEMILSAVSYEKKYIFYEKISKLTKNNTFDNIFVIEFFITAAS